MSPLTALIVAIQLIAYIAGMPQFTPYDASVVSPAAPPYQPILTTYPPSYPAPTVSSPQLNTFGLAPLLGFLSSFWPNLPFFRPPQPFPQQPQIMPYPQGVPQQYPQMQPIAAASSAPSAPAAPIIPPVPPRIPSVVSEKFDSAASAPVATITIPATNPPEPKIASDQPQQSETAEPADKRDKPS